MPKRPGEYTEGDPDAEECLLDDAVAALRKADRPVTFSGAGLSAESGIPTFREAQTGLWARYDPMTLASPGGFAADPELVIDWYNGRRRTIAAARPNQAHLAMAGRPDMIHITQNVDDLLERAGAGEIVHLHGTINQDKCSAGCGHREVVDLADPPPLRPCRRCGRMMRPAVVWFGEQLPRDEWLRADELAAQADVFVVIGTSARVYPAAGLITTARASGATVIVVNIEPDSSPGVHLTGPAGQIVPQLLDR
jgi:NAD-dependent deacetylase